MSDCKSITGDMVVSFFIATNTVQSKVAEKFTLEELGYQDGDFSDYGDFEVWLDAEYREWLANNTDSGWTLGDRDE
ncbi:hypothetical protein [Psychrobacter sanguinis]|uniref:hypothetical protein n=1 Tax=Psychrobacter sanguinis TaxID=861445 RepID=UPI002A74A834|nr:hypothetical protein [Psychrobacter sanguinis]MDY3306641.1 hypothetical protein [Psychrobacter sanguinis]